METERRKALAFWTLWMLWIFLAACLMWGLPDAFAAKGDPGGPRGGHADFGQRIVKVINKLDLTEAQKRDIALVLKEHRDVARSLVQQMTEARKSLFASVHAAEYNESTVRQAAHEVARCEEEMAVLRAKVVHEVKQILTPEQKTKLAAMRQRFGKRIEHRIEEGFDRLDDWIDAHGG